MKVNAFDFQLPEDRIAVAAVEPRDAARMLHVLPGAATPYVDRGVRDLPDLLSPGDALVFNDTRVIPARLLGHRLRGSYRAKVEFLLTERVAEDRWATFAKPAKRMSEGDVIELMTADGAERLEAVVDEKRPDGSVVLQFDAAGRALDFAIARVGTMPLPPYIAQKRAPDASDVERYQTVYAKADGAVAAPTAGLHFTPELMDRIRARGVEIHFVTLHVGAGTFLPVKVDDTRDHKMHSEVGIVTVEAAQRLNTVRARGGKIVAVGTTSLRLLESAARENGTLAPFNGPTSIFITPGYKFRVVDRLMTNFHLPRSTLFMLVSAFAGLETMRGAYAHAIANNYRFYSYGDASLLERASPDAP
jgi:S-adenosylmethionine:tRNA ribosyltransferase-isomerase